VPKISSDGLMARFRPSTAETAMLAALLIQRFAKDRGKEVSRLRLSRGSLRRLAVRSFLEDSWVSEFTEHMRSDQGWIVFADGDEFLFLKQDAVRSWTRIGTKRLDDILTRLRRGDQKAIRTAEIEIEPLEDEDEDEDD